MSLEKKVQHAKMYHKIEVWFYQQSRLRCHLLVSVVLFDYCLAGPRLRRWLRERVGGKEGLGGGFVVQSL